MILTNVPLGVAEGTLLQELIAIAKGIKGTLDVAKGAQPPVLSLINSLLAADQEDPGNKLAQAALIAVGFSSQEAADIVVGKTLVREGVSRMDVAPIYNIDP